MYNVTLRRVRVTIVAVATVTWQLDSPDSTNVPTAWYGLLDGAPDDGRVVCPKHVEQIKNSEIKSICKICASCWFFYTCVIPNFIRIR